ncbi:hypothetical protein ZIOFF_009730 [Zingiber officinale]|uniref:Cytochrome P450 84A1 n=1 Tax=Zingiber officinale TaxID=94328 RepID=A0A8J5HUF0_ZINOF|nr:hypothetical protein ZIOFF_009730 [Zingiber officinale]
MPWQRMTNKLKQMMSYVEWISYWKLNVTIDLVDDFTIRTACLLDGYVHAEAEEAAAFSTGADAAADHRQHADNEPADAPRAGEAERAVRVGALPPPPRRAARLLGVDAGAGARGAAGAGRRVLQPAGVRRGFVPDVRARRHGVRPLRPILAAGEEAVRYEVVQQEANASWASVQVELGKAVRAVAERADAGAAINVGELMFKMTMGIIFRAAFGTQSCGEQGEFIAIMQEFSRLFGAFNVGDFISSLRWLDPHGINRRLKAARGSLDKFINRIIDEHIANPKAEGSAERDMVDEMLVFLDEVDSGVVGGRTREEDELLKGQLRLTRNNIKAIIMDLMFGGTETVASAIEWAMAELMKNPDEMCRVQEELTTAIGGLDRQVQESDLEKLPYLKCVVKETLRLHPPIPLLLHETAEESQVAGFSVPAESRVMVNVWAIGRDRSVWKDAGEFRPARFAPGSEAAAVDFKGNFFEFLPFGSGRRSCPGMYLGLHALELAVAQMAHCFTWVLPGGMKPSELDMGDVSGLTAPRAVRLVAVPTHRLTCPFY